MAQDKTGAGIGQGAEVPAQGRVNHSKVDRGPKEEGNRVERTARKRLRWLAVERKCCSCPQKTRFRTDGICGVCGHRRCAECMLE